jgi:hypothetical protein
MIFCLIQWCSKLDYVSSTYFQTNIVPPQVRRIVSTKYLFRTYINARKAYEKHRHRQATQLKQLYGPLVARALSVGFRLCLVGFGVSSISFAVIWLPFGMTEK